MVASEIRDAGDGNCNEIHRRARKWAEIRAMRVHCTRQRPGTARQQRKNWRIASALARQVMTILGLDGTSRAIEGEPGTSTGGMRSSALYRAEHRGDTSGTMFSKFF